MIDTSITFPAYRLVLMQDLRYLRAMRGVSDTFGDAVLSSDWSSPPSQNRNLFSAHSAARVDGVFRSCVMLCRLPMRQDSELDVAMDEHELWTTRVLMLGKVTAPRAKSDINEVSRHVSIDYPRWH